MFERKRAKRLIETLNSDNLEYIDRDIPFHGGTIRVLFIKQLVDQNAISEFIIKPIIDYVAIHKESIRAQHVMDNVIYASDCSLEDAQDALEEHLLHGKIILLFTNDSQYILVTMKMVAHRGVPTPEVTYTLRGPKDCFAEDLDANISLIRYRIKDKNLRIDRDTVGMRAKSSIAIAYIEDVANNTVIQEVKKRIGQIHVDGIVDSGELEGFLLNNKINLFPQMGIVERSDLACHMLMEGKVVVLMEGSPTAIIAPRVFAEFFQSAEERYDNMYFGLFMRILRYVSVFLAVTISSYFVALVSFHTDAIPSDYIIMIAQMRSNVPFNAFIEAFLLEFLIEIIREALMRVPQKIGPAIGIVGAIVIGQAAIAAGIFSPLMLILAAVALLTSFVMPDYSLMSALRVVKFFILFMTGILGFYGLIMALSVIMINLISINSFGVPYMAPWAPYNRYDFIRTLINNKNISPKRSIYLRDKKEVQTSSVKQPNK